MTKTSVAGTAALARAAVLVTFDPSDLLEGGVEAGEVFDLLNESCEPVTTSSGHPTWSLTDSARRRALARLSLEQLQGARRTVEVPQPSPVQQALDQSLRAGWRQSSLAALSADDLRSLSVVAGWWQSLNPRVPDVDAVTALLDRANLFSDVRDMATDNFVGRAALLNELRVHLAGAGPAVFGLHGIGGIGKSALVARHVVTALDEVGALVARLDFDDPTLNPVYSLDNLARIVDLVTRQAEGTERSLLERLTLVAKDAADTARFRSESSSLGLDGANMEGSEHTIADLAALAGRPILVVFDTTEQVPRRGEAAVDAFVALVRELSRPGSIRVVVAGRAELPQLEITSREVSGLRPNEARSLFLRLCKRKVAPRTVARIIEAFGTSPLTVRLVAHLLSTDEQAAELDVELDDLLPFGLHPERVDAELYRRVLLHIRDRDVRRLAHPGLVLRRITPHVIRTVLARPCGVRVADERDAQDLFERLSREAMLVDRSHEESGVLIHRADIRRVMLPQLLADKPDLATRIQRAAVKYYNAREDLASRTEELYHRLMLGQGERTIRDNWDPSAGDALYTARDELPAASQSLLKELLPDTYLSREDRHEVSETRWLREVGPQISRLLAQGATDQALDLLRERRGRHGESLLPSLEIEALEAVGDLDGARRISHEQRQRAALANDVDALATYTLHLARLAEREFDWVTARSTLDEALAVVMGETVERLRLVVAWLGLGRRGGWREEEILPRKREAIALFESVGVTRIRRVPGLLRDLAAEVGDEHPPIQDAALRTIGVDARVGGRVPTALRDLEEKVFSSPGESPAVSEVARIDLSEGEQVEWDAIATKPRGETGRILLDVMNTFRDVDDVRRAVSNDYQSEADAALFRREYNVSRKS